jgi:glycerophosphoryl diester phosphodiesterase
VIFIIQFVNKGSLDILLMVLRIGHRGAAGYEPENTLRSFEAAVRLGADMTELDVHICSSGELVVIHDESVDRTTNGSGFIRNMTLGELKTLDAGKGEKIPTLKEVFSKLLGRISVNIELKGPRTAEPVKEFIDDLIRRGEWCRENVLITSFDWVMLRRLREISTDVRIGLLVYKNLDESLKVATEVEAYSVNPYHKSIDSEFIGRSHELNLRVYPWTVNEPEDIRRIVGLGVDGVISDYPDRIQ